MSNIRPTWPPKPSNPAASQGAPSNVGGGRDPEVIRPEFPPKPANPAASQGAPQNVAGAEKPIIRHEPPK